MLIQDDISRLDITMQQPVLLPRVIQGASKLMNNLQRIPLRNVPFALQLGGQRISHERHCKEIDAPILTGLMRCDNVGVFELCLQAYLLQEKLHRLFIRAEPLRKDLQSHIAIHRNLLREIHLAHCAAPDQLPDLESADGDSRPKRLPGDGHQALALWARNLCTDRIGLNLQLGLAFRAEKRNQHKMPSLERITSPQNTHPT